jgi:spore maturation protein CgeD
METNMKVTVILTSYNRDTLLRGAIESVLWQSFRDFELYIMDDDSSNPKTHEVLDLYETLPNVNVIRRKLMGVPRFSRTGYAESINLALGWSRGEYVTYLTCDDIFLPRRLERMVAHLDAHPDHMVCYGIQRLVNINPDGTMTERGLRNEGPVVKSAACLLDHNQIMHRRSCLPAFGTPVWPTNPEVIGMADACVWEKFRVAGWPFYRIDGDEPTDEHRFHRMSIQGGGDLS